jgi:alkylmercury lyase
MPRSSGHPDTAGAANYRPPVDIPALAQRFSAVFPHLDAHSGSVALTLYRLLARGEPVPWPVLANRASRDEAELRTLVLGWPGVYEEPEGLTGFGGLSVRPISRHAVRVGGRTLHTRCAWDTLFLPGVLGETLQVESACIVTGTPVRLVVTPERVQALEPAGTLLSLREPEPAMLADLTQHF